MTSSWIGIAVYAIAIGLLGYVLPSRMGFDFLAAVNIAGYAALAPVFAAALIGESRRATWTATLFGFVSVLLALSVALITVNQRYRFGKVLTPTPSVLLAALVFAAAAAYFTAAVGARLLARGWPVATVKAALRRTALLLLLLLLLSGRFLPPQWKTAAGGMLTDGGIVALLLGAAAACVAGGLVVRPRSVPEPQRTAD